MVETKTLTMGLEEVAPPVGEPEFRFAAWSLTDSRELFAVGAVWPSSSREYEEGETVKVNYKVKNVGTATGRWTIVVKDLDTGATIAEWYGDLAAGYSYKTLSTGATVGKMPAKDWRLSFKVTP